MQPIKLTIFGKFWDSQLYKGRLYLFDLDGSLRVVDWDKLIESFHIPDRCDVVMECAFTRSDYLYGNKWQRFFADAEIKSILLSKFDDLLKQNLEVSSGQLDMATLYQTNNPLPYAHNDALCYKDYLYGASQDGFFSHSLNTTGSSVPIFSQLWDAPISNIDVKLGVLALSVSEYGLFRSRVLGQSNPVNAYETRIKQVSRDFSGDCNYISSSILSFGYDFGASLIEYRSPKRAVESAEEARSSEYFNTEPLRTVEAEEIFEKSIGDQAYIWGSKNRMCMVQDGSLEVTEYQTTNPRRKKVAKNVATYTLPTKDHPVSADNAVFGTLIELDDSLLVIRSDRRVEKIKGEPTNWRVFPRSKYYINHLHVIFEDRMEILSYNHDYFVDQHEKEFGEPVIEYHFGL